MARGALTMPPLPPRFFRHTGYGGAARWMLALGAMLVGAWCPAQDRTRDEWQSHAPATRAMPPPGGRYTLGVQVRNTPTGVEVLAVQPGSPAQRGGLQPGDSIVTVGGYQVGFVGDRLFDIGDELARRTVGDEVTLLVRNGRTGGLFTLPVRFTAVGRAVGGQLLAEDSLPLPTTAVVTVRVLDVTFAQWRDVAITQGQLPVTGRFPVTYRLDLPPLPREHRYAVDARVEDRGQLLMHTPSPMPLPTVDGEARVDLMLSRRGLAPPATGTLAPRDQITAWIQAYLGRPPRPFEVEFWLADLQRGRSLVNVQAGILSSSELFERQRRDRDLYVAEVHRLLFGVPPTPAQMADLRVRYDSAFGVRLQFVEGLLMQPRS